VAAVRRLTTLAVVTDTTDQEPPDKPRRALGLALIGIGVAALLGAAGLVGAAQFSAGDESSEDGAEDRAKRYFVRERGGTVSSPPANKPKPTPCYATAYVRRATTLYRAPGGPRRIKLTARTEWGSPRILGVVKQRGGWLGVQAAELENGEIAWMRKPQATMDCSRWSLHADLSKRQIVVREDGKKVRKLTVAVGRPTNPTPRGRFTVTDKLRVTDATSPYGCCVLALTGHQTNLPPGWPGGDRLAVHATADEASIGQPSSSGCMRAKAGQARWLIHTIPLGAPVFIRA
jgi:L,D-transpeptidase catalytic domain